jgi:hypothetical protein
MAKGKEKAPSQRKKEIINKIIGTSNDARFAKELAYQLLDVQREIDNGADEVRVTTKSVTDTIDFGAVKFQRCNQGFLFTAKGGMITLVEWRMARLCGFIQKLFDIRDNPSEDEDAKKTEKAFTSAMCYIFQSPIFACVTQGALYKIAACELEAYNEAVEEKLERAKDEEPTEEEYKEAAEGEAMEEAISAVADAADALPKE